MTSTPLPETFPFAEQAPLTDEMAFSTTESPYYTMFSHRKNWNILEPFRSDGTFELDFKIQNIVLYGGFRLTEICRSGMRYADVVEEVESIRRMTWIQIGLRHELRYFLSFVGIAAASGWGSKLDIPPIMTYLSSIFGIATTEDLPVVIDDRIFQNTLFTSWEASSGAWASPWWMDTDFNMADPADPRNKTWLISDKTIMEALRSFWNTYQAIKMAEHAALTEGAGPHTSCRSHWTRKPNTSFDTCHETSWDNWNDMYLGIDILGYHDNYSLFEEGYQRYNSQNPEDTIRHARKDLAAEGLAVEKENWQGSHIRYPRQREPLRPDKERMAAPGRPRIPDTPLFVAGAKHASVRGSVTEPPPWRGYGAQPGHHL
ncbi:hypothetical protein BJ165DRAFT_1528829 [Panaeolus papilionaceus]|nr:hypothetical protein BJ165DRAFT_1528829 [Panaeolus papilionaceus]